MFISSLGFVKHVMDHSIYILQIKSTKDVLIVGCSTYDFLCASYSTHIFQYLLAGINNYFPVTSKEVP